MKKIFISVLFVQLIWPSFAQQVFISVSVDTILSGTMSVRAILPDGNKIWYAADQGRFGYYDFKENTEFEKRIVFDSLKPEFRSIAQTAQSIFILNVGSPALLYKISKTDSKPRLVYRETHKNAFYDSMQFWNDLEGIAIGDPTDGCLSVLITRDGGNSWTKMPCEKVPKTADGEAAFAASNSNIAIQDDNTWVVSGGKKSRVFFSPDKGKTWDVFDTPIVQGREMTGIFTADFYDAQTGFIAGGDYENQSQNFGNKAMTTDGGKTWQLIAEHSGFGYASCVQFVPNSNGKQLVSVGGSGLYYTADRGQTWKQLSQDKTLFTIRFVNEHTAFAAGKNKLVRIRFE